eukprot:jgi/Chlat1/9110/Chrsp97S08382
MLHWMGGFRKKAKEKQTVQEKQRKFFSQKRQSGGISGNQVTVGRASLPKLGKLATSLDVAAIQASLRKLPGRYPATPVVNRKQKRVERPTTPASPPRNESMEKIKPWEQQYDAHQSLEANDTDNACRPASNRVEPRRTRMPLGIVSIPKFELPHQDDSVGEPVLQAATKPTIAQRGRSTAQNNLRTHFPAERTPVPKPAKRGFPLEQHQGYRGTETLPAVSNCNGSVSETARDVFSILEASAAAERSQRQTAQSLERPIGLHTAYDGYPKERTSNQPERVLQTAADHASSQPVSRLASHYQPSLQESRYAGHVQNAPPQSALRQDYVSAGSDFQPVKSYRFHNDTEASHMPGTPLTWQLKPSSRSPNLSDHRRHAFMYQEHTHDDSNLHIEQLTQRDHEDNTASPAQSELISCAFGDRDRWQLLYTTAPLLSSMHWSPAGHSPSARQFGEAERHVESVYMPEALLSPVRWSPSSAHPLHTRVDDDLVAPLDRRLAHTEVNNLEHDALHQLNCRYPTHEDKAGHGRSALAHRSQHTYGGNSFPRGTIDARIRIGQESPNMTQLDDYMETRVQSPYLPKMLQNASQRASLVPISPRMVHHADFLSPFSTLDKLDDEQDFGVPGDGCTACPEGDAFLPSAMRVDLLAGRTHDEPWQNSAGVMNPAIRPNLDSLTPRERKARSYSTEAVLDAFNSKAVDSETFSGTGTSGAGNTLPMTSVVLHHAAAGMQEPAISLGLDSLSPHGGHATRYSTEAALDVFNSRVVNFETGAGTTCVASKLATTPIRLRGTVRSKSSSPSWTQLYARDNAKLAVKSSGPSPYSPSLTHTEQAASCPVAEPGVSTFWYEDLRADDDDQPVENQADVETTAPTWQPGSLSTLLRHQHHAAQAAHPDLVRELMRSPAKSQDQHVLKHFHADLQPATLHSGSYPASPSWSRLYAHDSSGPPVAQKRPVSYAPSFANTVQPAAHIHATSALDGAKSRRVLLEDLLQADDQAQNDTGGYTREVFQPEQLESFSYLLQCNPAAPHFDTVQESLRSPPAYMQVDCQATVSRICNAFTDAQTSLKSSDDTETQKSFRIRRGPWLHTDRGGFAESAQSKPSITARTSPTANPMLPNNLHPTALKDNNINEYGTHFPLQKMAAVVAKQHAKVLPPTAHPASELPEKQQKVAKGAEKAVSEQPSTQRDTQSTTTSKPPGGKLDVVLTAEPAAAEILLDGRQTDTPQVNAHDGQVPQLQVDTASSACMRNAQDAAPVNKPDNTRSDCDHHELPPHLTQTRGQRAVALAKAACTESAGSKQTVNSVC